MKKKIYLVFLLLFVLVSVSCNKSPIEENGVVHAAEWITGYVTNEKGNALEGIRVEAYLDEQMTIPYLYEGGKVVYTNENGEYTFIQASTWSKIQEHSYKDVFVVVSDTSGIYAPQMQKGQIIYDELSGVGNGFLDFVLYLK